MSEKQGGLFQAGFNYTEDILADFETMYLQKKELSPSARVFLGALGVAGALYFGYMIYREGLHFTRVGYLMICSILLVVAFSGGRGRPDDTPAKYRKHYLGRHASFRIDDEGVEMRLEGQKNYARSKFKEIYALNETDLCFYFVIKGKAYYILPKASITGGTAEEFSKYMQKKCGKRFQQYNASAK